MIDFRTESLKACPIPGQKCRFPAILSCKMRLARFLLKHKCMKTQDTKMNDLFSLGSDVGSAMMEYAILLAFIVVPLAIFVYKDVFNFSSSSFGSMGSLIRAFYQQLLGGLSLPVP